MFKGHIPLRTYVILGEHILLAHQPEHMHTDSYSTSSTHTGWHKHTHVRTYVHLCTHTPHTATLSYETTQMHCSLHEPTSWCVDAYVHTYLVNWSRRKTNGGSSTYVHTTNVCTQNILTSWYLLVQRLTVRTCSKVLNMPQGHSQCTT